MVDDQAIPGVRALRLDAKRLERQAVGILGVRHRRARHLSHARRRGQCLATSSGVHVVALGDLIKDLATRPRILEQSRVERAARVLGVQIAGDRKRHFA